MKKGTNTAIYIVLILVMVLSGVAMWLSDGKSEVIPYSKFQQMWNDDEIKKVVVKEDKMIIEGVTNDDKSFTSYVPADVVSDMMFDNAKDDVTIQYSAPSNASAWLSIIPIVILIILFLVFLFIFTQQSQGGGSGRSNCKKCIFQ